ncbi:MAG: glycerate kinase [Verrucomicrobia bacterium]|nr:glycerate kinase [Verrucomicrobiota bacterium]
MHVLVAPDKFKGSLSAAEACAALGEGLREGWPAEEPLEITCLPMADGGEGTAEAIHDARHGRWVMHTVHDPLGRPVQAGYALVEHGGERLAVLEMSSASGLALVSEADRDLLRASTFGTGELLAHALNENDLGRVIVGIGGSATNDGGVGLAAALGYRFLDAAGVELEPVPANLEQLTRIHLPGALPDTAVTVACDVVNPLLGPRGATRIYGPQKGLRGEEEALVLEAGLTRLADVAAETFGRDYRDRPGAGAAGGLGFGLLTFCRAEMVPGFELVSEVVGLEAAVSRADLVITGEGSLDGQTLEGKTPVGVADVARRFGKPVIAFGGRVETAAREALCARFDDLIVLSEVEPELTQRERMARAADLLRRHAGRLALRVAGTRSR